MNVEKRSMLTPNRWVGSEEHLLTILNLRPADTLWKRLKNSSE